MKPAHKPHTKRRRVNLDIKLEAYKRLKLIAESMDRSMNAAVEQLIEKWGKE